MEIQGGNNGNQNGYGNGNMNNGYGNNNVPNGYGNNNGQAVNSQQNVGNNHHVNGYEQQNINGQQNMYQQNVNNQQNMYQQNVNGQQNGQYYQSNNNYQQNVNQQNPYGSIQSDANFNVNKANNHKIVIIVIAIILVLLCCCGGGFFAISSGISAVQKQKYSNIDLSDNDEDDGWYVEYSTDDDDDDWYAEYSTDDDDYFDFSTDDDIEEYSDQVDSNEYYGPTDVITGDYSDSVIINNGDKTILGGNAQGFITVEGTNWDRFVNVDYQPDDMIGFTDGNYIITMRAIDGTGLSYDDLKASLEYSFENIKSSYDLSSDHVCAIDNIFDTYGKALYDKDDYDYKLFSMLFINNNSNYEWGKDLYYIAIEANSSVSDADFGDFVGVTLDSFEFSLEYVSSAFFNTDVSDLF